MKKILISMLLLVPMLTGCASIDTKITINDDKSASVATSVSYEGDLSDKSDINAVLIHDNFSKYLDKSYSVDKAFNSKLSTIIAAKKTADVTLNDLDLSSLGFVSNLPDGKFIEYKEKFLAKSYNIDMTYDFTKEAEAYEPALKDVRKNPPEPPKAKKGGLNPEYYRQYMDEDDVVTEHNDFAENIDETVTQRPELPDDEFHPQMPPQNSMPPKPHDRPAPESAPLDMSVSVEVPGYAFYNNADFSSGKVYTWVIKPDKPSNIKIQYVKYSGFGIAFVILAGIIILVLGAMKIVKHENQKRVGNTDNLAE